MQSSEEAEVMLSGGMSSNKIYQKPQEQNEGTLSNSGKTALKMRTELSDVAERKDARGKGEMFIRIATKNALKRY